MDTTAVDTIDTDAQAVDAVVPAPPVLTDEEIKQLVTDNIKLAYFFANKWKHVPGATEDDIRSQAYAGLVKAANSYDPSKGPFAAWASAIIRNYLGHLYHKQKQVAVNEPVSLSAPIGGGDDDEMTLGDVTKGDEPDVARSPAQADAVAILHHELDQIPEPNKSWVKRWMAGESYRDMAADSGRSFVYIGAVIRAELEKIKQNLATKGLVQFSDIWPEGLDNTHNGRQIYECLVLVVEMSAAARSLNAASKAALVA